MVWCWICTALSAVLSQGAVFFVSPAGENTNPGSEQQPFKTIKKAQQAVRDMTRNGLKEDVTVIIQSGTYILSEPLKFDARDGGTAEHSVTYRHVGSQEPLISGGRSITGWVKTGEKDIWSVRLEDVKNGLWFFRDLYAGDRRLVRARFPNEGQWMKVENFEDTKTFGTIVSRQNITADQDIPGGNLAISDTEIVMPHIWEISRTRVMNVQGRLVSGDYPIGLYGFPFGSVQKGRRFFLEHARAFIDVPGEWYLDRNAGVLYYMAEPGGNPNEEQFFAPFLTRLVHVKGTAEEPVKNLHFKGLRFEHADWVLPLGGYNGLQACYYGTRYATEPTYALPLAIHLENADGVTFEECRLAHTGASGLGFGAGCHNNRVTGCEFYDIGGNGVMVGWKQKCDAAPRYMFENGWNEDEAAPQKNEISHNLIHRCGAVQYGGVGVFAAFSGYTKIEHNEIYDLPYSGISAGYVWNDYPTPQHHAVIAYNYIHNVMTTLDDGAAIYVLGSQPGTKIVNNLVHDVPNGRGLYNDGVSAHMHYESNIVYKAQTAFTHKGHHHTVKNNIFASSPEGYIHVVVLTEYLWLGFDPYAPESVFENNVFYMDSGKLFWRAGEKQGKKFAFYEKRDGRNPYIRRNNLYWDPRTPTDGSDIFSAEKLQALQQDENDHGSVFADPLFVDPAHGDFSLKKNSPALKVGFKPIDISTVGPQRKHYKKTVTDGISKDGTSRNLHGTE